MWISVKCLRPFKGEGSDHNRASRWPGPDVWCAERHDLIRDLLCSSHSRLFCM